MKKLTIKISTKLENKAALQGKCVKKTRDISHILGE
jgi:hypothetical protein